MKVIVLTTETLHHTYYVKKITYYCENLLCIIEKQPSSIFTCGNSSFITDSMQHEKNVFFGGKTEKLEDVCPTRSVDNINDLTTTNIVNLFNPDIIIVYGTRQIHKSFLMNLNCLIVNLHGGNPEEYRGLDTNLWAAYHNDFSNVSLTIHKVLPRLDTGAIYSTNRLNISKLEGLHQLRATTTMQAIADSETLLKSKNINLTPFRKQRKLGRYYSSFPNCLLKRAQRNFEIYYAPSRRIS